MGTQGAERPLRLATIGGRGRDRTGLTPALLSIRRAALWWPGVPGTQPLIRNHAFVAQYRREAGLTAIFA